MTDLQPDMPETQPPAAQPRSPAVRLALRVAGAALVVVMLAVVVQALRRDGPAALAAWRAAHVRWEWVTAAFACAFFGHAAYVIGWRRLLSDAGVRVGLWPLARIFLVSNLGRYLPGGKAWQMGIVAMMATEIALPAAAVAASSLFQGVVGMGVGAIVLLAAGGASLEVATGWLAVPVAGVVGLLFAPAIVRATPPIQRLLAQRAKGFETLTAATMWTLVWTSMASWIFWGLALFALATSLLPNATVSVSAYITAWTGSFLAGLIAVVSPAGLGAREGIMQAVLEKAGMIAGDALVLVLVSRVWATLLDVVPAVLVLAIRKRQEGTSRSASVPTP